MAKKDPRIDAYIQESNEFARPILKHLRKLVRENCPEAEETLKWDCPHFLYGGQILCGMAAFKKHCLFGFWKGALFVDSKGKRVKASMGQVGGKIASLDDLPSPTVLKSYLRQAMKLTDSGVKIKRPPGRKRPPLQVPLELMRALRGTPKALARFEAFSPSAQRDYADWISGAKTDETRERRLETAVEWISEGKPRYWKYRS